MLDFPPIGTSEPPINTEPNASSYVGNGSNYNNRVNTSGIKTTNPPKQSFNTTPAETKSPSTTQSSDQTSQPPSSKTSQSPSSITPAPNTAGAGPQTSSPQNLPDIPAVTGAFPTPFGSGDPQSFPNPNSSALNPRDGRSVAGLRNPSDIGKIPSSKQRVIPIISESVPYQYPEAACRDALQGTATLSYYRQPNGSYVDGSGTFEYRSGYPILDDAALNAVIVGPTCRYWSLSKIF